MKRVLSFLLAGCLALTLAACGKKPVEDTTGETTAATTAATTQPTTEATTQATEPVTTAPPEVVYRNPLNGEKLEEPWSGRATAVVINNIKAAQPQYGVSEADILYEIETEGGITRCLAIFHDLEGVGKIGPVRSARTFFNNDAVSYDAPLVHCGGSGAALNAQYDDSGAQISNWQHINEMYNGSYFFRDLDRYNNQGYSWEHTLFTNGENLVKALDDNGYAPDGSSQPDYGLQFDEEATLNGDAAAKVTVKFRGGKTTTMTYNADTGLYEAAQYGQAYKDAGNGELMTFRNVLVLYAEQWSVYDGTYDRSYFDLIGTGDGCLAMGGKSVPIKWVRENLNDPFTYTLADGTPVTLGVGTSYVGVVPPSSPVSCE